MIEELTIRKLRRNIHQGDFQAIYNRMLLDNRQDLDDSDVEFMFRTALLFLNYGDYSLAKLGYRIILRYSNLFKDYQPLYDISLNKGYIPISRFIETAHFNSEEIGRRFFNTFLSAFKDNFQKDGIYLSYGQRSLIDFSSETESSFVLVAPTSYGKSEIMLTKVLEHADKKVCIIVPSKALLAQTKRRLLHNPTIAAVVKRVITHPEMYKGTEKKFVAVLTQERLLRLQQRHLKLTLDLILVDEAHNLLRGESRATLLTQVLLIAIKRNPNLILNFFTPFIADSKSLETPHAEYKLKSQSTTEYLKVERFYHLDLSDDKRLHLYDQFLDKSFLVNNIRHKSEIEFVRTYKSNKNIVYLNKPRDIEKLARELSQANKIQLSQEVRNHLRAISDFLHPDYKLLDCIRSGVVYHHGGMPDVIRLYVENIFTTVPGLEFIVTNSTLLEGVNIPAEKIFILANKIGRSTLTKSQFKNLIGRVCRFSEVFHKEKGNLNLLEPEIYLIKGNYADKRSNLLAFLKKNTRPDLSVEDEIQNLLLVDPADLNNLERRQLHESLEYLENIEPNTVNEKNVTYVKSEIAQLCFQNNVYDFDIVRNEKTLIDNLKSNPRIIDIKTTEGIMDAIHKIFIKGITIIDEGFQRLDYEPARKFYSMVLEWRTTGSSYKQMIGKFTKYWNSLKNPIIFAGSKWGEITLNDHEEGKTLYIDLRTKTEADKVNLAILRIKEEQDYVDNNLIKYIEILNDLGLMNREFYEKIKYGTADGHLICLLKNGFSLDLAKCIRKLEYAKFVRINLDSDEVYIDKGIIGAMEANLENPIFVFEVTYHVN